jgi:hypothetical protein
MDTVEIAKIVRAAAKAAVMNYLEMCQLDSPWEVPEAFMVCETAKALHHHGHRVFIEFRLDSKKYTSGNEGGRQLPTRLQKSNAHLDLAIIKSERDPWAFNVDGIVEFKRHNSLADDAELIEFMVSKKQAAYGLLAMLIVGATALNVERECSKLTGNLLRSGKWKSSSKVTAQEFPPIQGTDVEDRWWDVCCLVTT